MKEFPFSCFRNFSFFNVCHVSTLACVYIIIRGNHHIYHNRRKFFPDLYEKTRVWNFGAAMRLPALSFFELFFFDKRALNFWSKIGSTASIFFTLSVFRTMLLFLNNVVVQIKRLKNFNDQIYSFSLTYGIYLIFQNSILFLNSGEWCCFSFNFSLILLLL